MLGLISKKSIIIHGEKLSKKLEVAETLALSCGPYSVMQHYDMNSYDALLKVSKGVIKTVVVICPKKFSSYANEAGKLMAAENIRLEVKGSDAVEFKTPNFIFVTGSPEMIPMSKTDARFMIIEVK